MSKKLTIEEFIKKSKEIHGDKYDYSLVTYNGIDVKVDIICNKHGIFKQTPSLHIYDKCGCSKCAKINSRITINDFIEKSKLIHGNKYDYSLVDYKNQRTKIKIICPLHGEYEQTPNKHLQNRGCPHCKMSKGEIKIKKYLDEKNIHYIYEHKFNNCLNIKKLSFDFFIPMYNMCIEYDGELHFKSIKHFGGKEALQNQQYKDSIKTKYCKNNNIKLLRIKYTENIIDILDEHFKLLLTKELHFNNLK